MEGAENLDASTVKKVAVTALPPSLLPPPSSHLPPPPQDNPSHVKSLVEGGAAPAVASDAQVCLPPPSSHLKTESNPT